MSTSHTPAYRRTALPSLIRSLAMALMLCACMGAQAKALQISEQEVQQAAQLRMLAQRTAKFALQIQLGIRALEAKRKMNESIAQFEATLARLKQIEGSTKLARALDSINYNWDDLKAQVARRDPGLINQASEEVSFSIQRASKLLEAESGTNVGKLVALSVEQSTLSQRMAKLYFMAYLGHGKESEADVTRDRFGGALQTLLNARENSAGNTQLLMLAKNQWLFYDHALKESDRRNAILMENVATTSERITEVMSDVVSNYARSAR